MKKILLVGELNQIMGSLNEHLSTKFRTQMCMDNVEQVKSMEKVFKPDMVVIYLMGVGELDNRILDHFKTRYSHVPMLLVGTTEECNFYQKYYEDEQFDFVIRPTTLGMLLQKCEEMLRIFEPEKETEAVAEEEAAKKCVLAVDDSGILLRSVKTMLEMKYDVAVANSGMMAIKQAKKRIPDLILLDYEMPEWDGKRTLEEIRNDEDLKDIPVVFLTSVSDKTHITAVLALRPSGYLLKPIEPQLLMDTIERAMIKI